MACKKTNDQMSTIRGFIHKCIRKCKWYGYVCAHEIQNGAVFHPLFYSSLCRFFIDVDIFALNLLGMNEVIETNFLPNDF